MTKMYLNSETPTEPDLTFSRIFNAPRELVFQAWTNPNLLEQWFCPTGFSVDFCEVNAQPGGFFRIHMRSPEGIIYPTKGEYREIVPPVRLVYLDTWDDDRAHNPEVQTIVTFEEEGNKTHVTLYSIFSSEQHRNEVLSQGAKDGWKMFLDNLEKVLPVMV